MQSDKRKSVRQPLRYPAWIAIEGHEKRSCMLSDISDHGARLEIDDAQNLPDQFVLLLSANNGPRRNCRIAWRESGEVGVHFEKNTIPVERAATRSTDTIVSLPLPPDQPGLSPAADPDKAD